VRCPISSNFVSSRPLVYLSNFRSVTNSSKETFLSESIPERWYGVHTRWNYQTIIRRSDHVLFAGWNYGLSNKYREPLDTGVDRSDHCIHNCLFKHHLIVRFNFSLSEIPNVRRKLLGCVRIRESCSGCQGNKG